MCDTSILLVLGSVCFANIFLDFRMTCEICTLLTILYRWNRISYWSLTPSEPYRSYQGETFDMNIKPLLKI